MPTNDPSSLVARMPVVPPLMQKIIMKGTLHFTEKDILLGRGGHANIATETGLYAPRARLFEHHDKKGGIARGATQLRCETSSPLNACRTT